MTFHEFETLFTKVIEHIQDTRGTPMAVLCTFLVVGPILLGLAAVVLGAGFCVIFLVTQEPYTMLIFVGGVVIYALQVIWKAYKEVKKEL